LLLAPFVQSRHLSCKVLLLLLSKKAQKSYEEASAERRARTPAQQSSTIVSDPRDRNQSPVFEPDKHDREAPELLVDYKGRNALNDHN
jgi:hypothetical protein